MLNYNYSAKDVATGKIVKAQIQAETEKAAANMLIERDLIPLEISTKDSKNIIDIVRSRVRNKDRVLFTRQLATLINAGLPLAQSLRTVEDQTDSKPLKAVVSQIISDVEGGSSLANAFSRNPKVFNPVYVNLIAAGESSGTLDETLDRLATQQEKDASITAKIRGALTYPLIVLIVIFGVIIFMITTVLPQIGALYKDLNKELPTITAVLLWIANIFIHYWPILILAFVAVIYGMIAYSATETGKRIFDRMKMKMPLFGQLFMLMYMARFARTASTLLSSGVQMLESLDISGKAVNNIHVQESLERAANQVKGGGALSKALEDDPNFLRLVPQMINIGEQSGAIDELLAKIAVFYEEELDNKIKAISTIIEPALMVVLAIVVGFIVGAILLPVYGLVGDSLSL
ncbi:type II secretion system F family protein [Candidatus Saccharibacteria bacterium]|nr:type II secretion system F family protein [Candidatus Saccharibacteria bacterium]MBP9131512.1 type II secretion system F family protein [Candidatus Saccharibacteria bacterium]